MWWKPCQLAEQTETTQTWMFRFHCTEYFLSPLWGFSIQDSLSTDTHAHTWTDWKRWRRFYYSFYRWELKLKITKKHLNSTKKQKYHNYDAVMEKCLFIPYQYFRLVLFLLSNPKSPRNRQTDRQINKENNCAGVTRYQLDSTWLDHTIPYSARREEP